MCQLAVKAARQPLMVDPWEPLQASYCPTAIVLDHFDREINGVLGGCGGKKVRIALLAGADLVETMSQEGVWSYPDLQHILGDFGAFVVERASSNIDQALSNLREWRDNLHYIPAIVSNPMSSTMLRLLLKGSMSIEYVSYFHRATAGFL
jgi:nicotinamide mononucleotide adenylyltransferase